MANRTKTKPVLSDILCPVGGIAAFLASYFPLALPLWLSALAAAAVFLAVALIFRPNRFRLGKIQTENEAEYRSLESIIGDGYQRIDELHGYVRKVRNPAVSAQVAKICSVGDKIFGYIQKNPQKVRGARLFFTYYLDTTCNILNRYCELESQGVNAPEIAQSMARAEHTIGLLAQAVEKQLANLLQNDVFDLETELSLLEQTIKSESGQG